jgi:hypothetical protein
MSRCLFNFVTQARPSRPFYALRSTPKTALKFGRSVGHGEVTRTSRCLFSFVTQARPSRPFYALWATPKTALNFGRSIGRSVGQLVGHGEVTQTSRCFFSFFTQARPSRPFYALRATPKTALNFGRSVSRPWRSHTNVMLSLQFRQPGPPFPTLLRPAGHPQNSLKFWSVDRSVGHGEVTRMSRCLFSFVTRARPSRPLYALWATPKTALNFGRSVTGKSHERHDAYSVSSPGPTLLTLLRPAGHSKNDLKFWSVGWLVGRLVGQSVGRSRGIHTNVTLLLQFCHPSPPFPTHLRPAGHPQNGLQFWLVGRLVGRSRGSHTNVMLPLQFCHPGPPFPTALRPAGHPQKEP